MSSIDNKIVHMGFDNKQFETGVRTSMKTLESLNDTLKLKGASDGLSELNKTASKMDLGGLGNVANNVADKLSLMGIVGVTALVNIANSAVNTGKQMISALTIEPLTRGFEQYERKVGAVQVIMSATGESIETVTEYIKTLNEYSDKTIYSFGDMTDNIGKFTNAGVNLDDATKAIIGVSNAAALSGATSMEASRAMYNFSQALSTGSVKLIDWKSIENANMATVEFKNQLIEAAVAAGTLADAGEGMYSVLTTDGAGKKMEGTINATQAFNDSLTYQWMTSEVLVDTLKEYADETTDIGKKSYAAAQEVRTFSKMMDALKESAWSGWGKTWELIFGDMNEATELWTGVSNAIGGAIGAMDEYRNSTLEVWKEQGGRQAVLDGLINVFKTLKDVIKPIGQALMDVFPPTTGEALVDMSKRFKELTENFKIGDATADKLRRTFSGVFSVISLGVEIVQSIAKAFFGITGAIFPATGGILDFTASIGDFITGMVDAIKQSEVFTKIVETIVKVAEGVGGTLKSITDAIKNLFNGGFDLKKLGESVGELLAFVTPLEKLGDMVTTVFDKIKKVFDKIGEYFYKISGVVSDAVRSIMEQLSHAFSGEATGMDALLTGGALAVAAGVIFKIIKNIKDFFSDGGGVFSTIKSTLDSVKDSLEEWQNKLKANNLLKIAGAIGILAASLMVIASIDSDKLVVALTSMAVMFGELMGAMAIFGMILDKYDFKGVVGVATSMILLSTAILILSSAMKNMAELDWNGVAKGLVSTTTLLGALVLTSKTISKDSKGMIKSAIAMVILGKAIEILAESVEVLGGLDINQLTKGLVGVGVLLTELTLFMKMTDLGGMGILKATGILILAQALQVMSGAVESMSSINFTSMMKGLGGIALILTQIALFMKATQNTTGIVSTAIGLTILGVAINSMAKAVDKFANIPFTSLAKGLGAMASSLIIVAGAMRIMPKGMIGQAAALVAIGGALNLIGLAVRGMGTMEWDEIGRGLVVLGGALLILAGALNLMRGTLGGAAAIVVVSAGLALLTPQLILLGMVKMETIGKSLLFLGGALAVLGVAGLLIAPLAVPLMALAGAIALIGLASAAVGAGVGLFAAGMATLAVSGMAGAAGLAAILGAVIGLIPAFAKSLANGFLAFIKVITNNTPIILDGIKSILISILDAVIEVTPKLGEAFLSMLNTILNVITEGLPALIDAGIDIVLSVLNGIAEHIGDFVTVGIDIVVNFLNGIASKLGDVIECAFNLIVSFINGLSDSIRKNNSMIFDAVRNLINAIVESTFKLMPNIITIGGDIINGMVQGVINTGKALVDAVMSPVKTAVNAVKNFLDINSPSKLFMQFGEWTSEGMAIGIDNKGYMISDSALDASESAADAMRSALSAVSVNMEADAELTPTITPVLDLSNVNSGMKDMKRMTRDTGLDLGTGRSFGLVKTTALSMSNNPNGQNDDVISAIKDLGRSMNKTKGNTYNTISGITYDNDSSINGAIKEIIRAARIERRV